MECMSSINGVVKTVLNAGEGDIPKYEDGSKITFHFRTHALDENGDQKEPPIDDSKKIKKPMELISGKKFKMPVWEQCLGTMKVGEIARFIVKKNLVDAYPLVSKGFREFAGISQGKKGHHCGMMAFTEGIGHNDLDMLIREPGDLQFTIELVKVEHPGEYVKESWVMNPEEKLHSIPTLKETGNEFYKQQQYDQAAKKYAEALGMLEQLLLREKPGEEEWLELEKQKIPILSNYAQCKLLQKDYYSVIEHTTNILESDKNNIKALYRRGKAYVGIWDLDLARSDFEKVAELDSSFQTVIQKELKNIIILQKEKDDDIKNKLYGKAFGEKS